MAWNTEQTRQKVKDAALVEFSAVGPDGTTIEKIARRAGVNKERIYNYFGNKRELFALILSQELDRIAQAVPVDAHGPLELGEYVGRLYDYHREHPGLNRLVLWEGLSFEREVPREVMRSVYYQERVAALRRQQEAGWVKNDVHPAALAFFLMALAGWWSAVPQIARMTTAPIPEDDHRWRRANAVAAARVFQS